jgi:hypothetical protein
MDNWMTYALRSGPVVLTILIATPVFSRDIKGTQPNETQLDRHGYYLNKTGQSVHQPAHSLDGEVPTGASARCRDGNYSFSQHSSGTCSGHGGVDDWLR